MIFSKWNLLIGPQFTWAVWGFHENHQRLCTFGTFLVVQWLRLSVTNEGGPGSILGQGTRSHMLQTKIRYSQIKKDIVYLDSCRQVQVCWAQPGRVQKLVQGHRGAPTSKEPWSQSYISFMVYLPLTLFGDQNLRDTEFSVTSVGLLLSQEQSEEEIKHVIQKGSHANTSHPWRGFEILSIKLANFTLLQFSSSEKQKQSGGNNASFTSAVLQITGRACLYNTGTSVQHYSLSEWWIRPPFNSLH